MSAIRTAQSCPNTEASLGKVHSVADVAADAVIFQPFNVRLVHAALIDQVLNKPPHGIIGEGRHARSVQTEAPLKAASHIIFAASFPNFERPRRMDPFIARIEAKHYLTETNNVPFAIIF